jgi:DNA-binding protein H-NS
MRQSDCRRLIPPGQEARWFPLRVSPQPSKSIQKFLFYPFPHRRGPSKKPSNSLSRSRADPGPRRCRLSRFGHHCDAARDEELRIGLGLTSGLHLQEHHTCNMRTACNVPLCHIHSVQCCLCFDAINLLGIPVAKPNLSGMDFESLVKLRQQVEERLHDHRATIEKQLEALGSSIASVGRSKVARGGRGSTLKGTKVAPKYRSPDGETWAGRGATPRWLKAAIKEGKKLESFLIDKTGAKRKARG